MNGAVFFLGVNFIITLSFSAVFVVVSTRSRSRDAALWLAAGFAVASLSAICELLTAYSSLPKAGAVGAFASVLGGMILLRVGVGELYGSRLKLWVAAVVLLVSTIADLYLYELPRSSFVYSFTYQLPFALVMLASAAAVFSSRRRLPIDRALGSLLLFTGLHFFAKGGLAPLVGTGETASDYIHTNYALISQSLTAILVVAVGLTMLAVLILEIMADERSKSEKDTLSGLANRRGLERRVQETLVALPGTQHAVILCDLDHFKNINDTYGHHAGDMVIRAFGEILRASAPKTAVVARIGGEEFAVFMPNTSIEIGMLFAQALRGAAMALTATGLPTDVTVTASFGVSLVVPGVLFDEALREADVALYEAKRTGRNRVKQAQPDFKLHTVEAAIQSK